MIIAFPLCFLPAATLDFTLALLWFKKKKKKGNNGLTDFRVAEALHVATVSPDPMQHGPECILSGFFTQTLWFGAAHAEARSSNKIRSHMKWGTKDATPHRI